jgi:DnaK suppressor protein
MIFNLDYCKREIMTNSEKSTVKAQIKLELTKLKAQIIKLKEATKPIAPDCSLGRLTRVEAMNEQVINMKILEEAELRQTRLNNALSRIEDEMFGVCIECDEPIGIGRMLVRPESVRCIGCAL